MFPVVFPVCFRVFLRVSEWFGKHKTKVSSVFPPASQTPLYIINKRRRARALAAAGALGEPGAGTALLELYVRALLLAPLLLEFYTDAFLFYNKSQSYN